MRTDFGIKLKVCGMRESGNVSDLAALKPDYMGFIFYPKSSRFVGALAENTVHFVKQQGIVPVAVFVNASIDSIVLLAGLYGFTHVQLHGNETPQTCAALENERAFGDKGF